jgi:hypothetical protein
MSSGNTPMAWCVVDNNVDRLFTVKKSFNNKKINIYWYWIVDWQYCSF